MSRDPIDRLVEIGFSEYEAKAYVALLRENPVSGYGLSKLSGVPRSMIYEVLGKLTARGAAITLHKDGATRYAPVPATEFLDKLRREHELLVTSLKDDLASLASASDPEYVWNIEGEANIMAMSKMMPTRRGRTDEAPRPKCHQRKSNGRITSRIRGSSKRIMRTAFPRATSM